MRHATVVLSALCTISCVRAVPSTAEPQLDVAQISARLPQQVADRDGWARDLRLALETLELPADAPHVCAVVAVVGQESGFEANPRVPRLAAIARQEVNRRAEALGLLGEPLMNRLLQVKAKDAVLTFDQRLSAVKTEADLDRLYRDAVEETVRRFPVAVVARGQLEQRNPITTAGSMQVSVEFAERTARKLGRDPARVRDELYTRHGGLLYGTARLFSGASKVESTHRFADYNAGEFASRNAAFQEQLAALTGEALALDGDLLAYRPYREDTHSARALSQLNPRFVADARLEKSERFEQTAAWRAVKEGYRSRFGREPAYARLPEVKLRSPKLSRELSTAWFARSVQRRYDACLGSKTGKN